MKTRNEIIVLKDNVALTTSLILSESIGVEHRAILILIRKYKDREILKSSAFEMRKLKTKGRDAEYYYLTESQSMFILTLMNNSEKVLDFKESLINAFVHYRQVALKGYNKIQNNIDNQQWIEERTKSKVIRKECTDVIKVFIEYAKEQGSESADKYYMVISKMQLKCLFLLEQRYPSVRDLMNARELNLMELADDVIAKSFTKSMLEKLPYKECFQIAKERVIGLTDYFPVSPLAFLLLPQPKELTNE